MVRLGLKVRLWFMLWVMVKVRVYFFIEFSLACMPSEFGSNITKYKAITNAI